MIVAGEAQSHCVAWTVEDLLSEIRARDPRLAEKIVLLDDCTSPVVVPGVVDFTDAAEAAYARFAAAGMRRAALDGPAGELDEAASSGRPASSNRRRRSQQGRRGCGGASVNSRLPRCGSAR